MFFKSLLAATTMAFFAAQAAAAPSGSDVKASANDNVARAAFIAPDAINACNCPNNCQHKLGDSCKFYQEGYIVTAVCRDAEDHLLECKK